MAGFWEGWQRFGDAPALVSGSDTISYAELDALVDATLQQLGLARRLVMLSGQNTLDAVVTYLAALRGGHPVILVDGGRPQAAEELAARFDPDLVIGPQGWQERRVTSRHGLHPGLRLLLSTSGSTASPKLVRLSADNLASNARAIAAYLGLTAADRAVTSLPLAYSYGLSVLHSHLEVGASVVLTQHSVIEPEFWSLARAHGVTSFAAVPHTFALLERGRDPWYAIPTLRYVTSAGGRLDPAEVRRLATLGRRHGWQLYVMYGQTEATARMAYLDPAAALTRPECVGRAVPGGQLRVDRPDASGVGELVYAGPNVMMGYAESAADLATGPTLSELRTGDLGRQHADGLVEVVGRTSRFAKLLGHRIDLDRVQSTLSALDPTAVCLSDDERLLVAVTQADPRLVRTAAARATGLPPGLVDVRAYAALPLLPNGKPDLAALRASAQSQGEPDDLQAALCTAYEEVLGFDRVDPDASFVRLGGDSLSFVEMAFRLEELLGRLPPGWPEQTISQLAGANRVAEVPATSHAEETTRAPTGPASEPRPGPRRPTRWGLAWPDTSLVLRAAAITLVVMVHLQVTSVRGGAHLLLAVAGYTFARFPLAALRESDQISGLLRSLARLVVPTVVFIAVLVVVKDQYHWWNALLLNHVFGPPRWTESWTFWFVEVLVTILVAVALLLAVPAVRRLERRHRTLLPALAFLVGWLLRPDVLGPAEATMRYGRPLLVFWLFALGWLIQVSPGLRGRLLVTVLVLASLPGYFPGEPVRGWVVQAGLLLLTWLPVLPLPRLLTPVVHRVAAASLWIYLTHWVVWPVLLEAGLSHPATVLGCLVVGVATAGAVGRLQAVTGRLVSVGTRGLAAARARGRGPSWAHSRLVLGQSSAAPPPC